MAPNGELTLSDAQELVASLARSLGVSKAPVVTTECPWAPERIGPAIVLGAFHPAYPDVICVRDLKPETVAHEFGHWYYHWYIAPAVGRYSEAESEAIARRFEQLARKVSFRCQVCGGGVLMKTETPVCSWCGAQYQVEEEDVLAAKMLIFGGLATLWGWFFTWISRLGIAPIVITGREKQKKTTAVTRTEVPSGISPVLIAILTATATHITYEWVKKRLGWD